MKLAAVQFRPEDKGNWQRSCQRLCALVEEAAGKGAQLVVCPEMALTGYLFADRGAARTVAELPAAGPTYRALSAVARAHRLYLVIGYPELSPAPAPHPGDRLFNSALLIGPQGSLLYNYRKRLLYECDKTWADEGDRPYPLLTTPMGVLSAGICMDLNDDRFTSFLRLRRPRLVAFCTNWINEGFDIRPYWRRRLHGAGCYFIAANTYGLEKEGTMRAHFLGRSAVLGPDGRTLAIAPEIGDQVLLVDVPDLAP